MKVLHVVGDSKFGGAAVVIFRLAELAKSLGWQVDVLTTDPTFQKVLQEAGIGIVPLEAIWREIRPVQDLKGLNRLYRFLKEKDYTLVHTHTSKAGFVGRLAARLAGVPVIVHTVQGFAFHEQSSPLALQAYSTLERLAARWCDLLVTVSEFHRSWALSLGIGTEDKIAVIPNGINPERVQPTLPADAIRHSWGVSHEELALLLTGRLAPQKGHEYLIQAIPILAKHLKRPFRVILAGDGPLREAIEAQVQSLGIQEQVVMLGFRSDIGNLLAASNIVVIPSLWEGLSVALLEAMATGKPIVTTTIGSNLEVIRDRETALLVPPKDPQSLAQAIIELAENPNLAKRIAEKAQALFESNYTEETMLQNYKAVYFKLLKQKGLSAGVD